MSSEGIVSVVGSEMMPLDYGSMDAESSLSPSGSERTVEERRDQRVVEEEENEIPSNILEAGGDVDGCYDPDLDIVSEVRGYVSELGNRSSLKGLVENCNLPHHVLIRPAGVNEFPIPELLVGLLLDYSIGITQLTPNAPEGKGEKGWYYFDPRSSSKENRNLFSAGPSSIKGWKKKFFFVDDTEWSRRDAEVEQLSAWKGKKTNPKAIEAAELYGPSSLSEVEMDSFINATGGLRIPKKPRKKSKTSTAVEKGVAERERQSNTSARAVDVQPRLDPVMGGSEGASEEVAPLQRKKRKVAESAVRRDELVEFVPRPSPPEKSLFEATNTTGAKRFLNATLPEVDRRQATQEAVGHLGATVVRHALEVLLLLALQSASWTNALAQEYAESVRDRASLQRQCEQLQKEREELQKEKEEWEKEKREMQRRLDEVLPSVTELQNDNDVLSMKLVLEERKRKICEEKLEAQDKYIENMRKGAVELKKNVNLLVHNGMEEHIGNFLNFSVFENIINLWEHDAEGRTIFPPAFDAELVVVEEEGEEEEARGARVEDQANLAEVQPPEVHPISSDEVQQLVPPEAEAPPLPTGDESLQPPLPAEERPPPSAD
ncbi:hypothetical protein SLEP1_g57980 [Rubroshorea leprosula]|uniref:Uncharacterized protein n=1 Tax=Rubroshorea leprosula TaxID=152421 RepID=A0AAV5MN51_9ROSI|nr:hypothetical protein SLEP1_g57980 [Rubroshorea leprosula]